MKCVTGNDGDSDGDEDEDEDGNEGVVKVVVDDDDVGAGGGPVRSKYLSCVALTIRRVKSIRPNK